MKNITLLIALFFLTNSIVFAQAEIDSKLLSLNQEKIESIELIKKNLIQAKNKLIVSQALMQKETDPQKKINLEKEVKRHQDRYDKVKLNLISIITNVKIDELQKEEINKKRDYMQEAQELLGPAFDTIQRISERPRKIEALRKELQINQNKLAIAQMALKNIEEVKSSQDFKTLLPDVEEFLSDSTYNVNDLIQEFTLKIDRLNRELTELTKDDQTIFGAATSLTKEFFSNKGKHLTVSFIVFLLTFWSLTILKNKVVLNLLARSKVEWIFKPISALYGIITFVLALTLSIVSLYLMGDWVLVTISVLLISAILWGSKNYLHKYLAEGRLILNLGTIKEGELIIFRGIPWKVKSINFVTIFENEYLDSSIIRVEIAQIFHMHSRKILPNEQWFPTRTNDWVILSDGTFGQIKLQTVEQVIVEINSAERKYFTTTDYLNLRPTNLSHGFVIDFFWGLDYQIQNQLASELLPAIKDSFTKHLKNYQYSPVKFSVDFHSAGASSLNLIVLVHFKGEHAAYKLLLQRDMQKIMLMISNELNLTIPYNQIVVHQARNIKN